MTTATPSSHRARIAARDQELTPRGQRTKDALLAAARRVFERDGFLAARVTDIAAEAQVAHGTFYTYFDSKDDIFRALVLTLQTDFHERDERPVDPLRRTSEPPYDKILRANHRYYETYRNRGRMMGIVEQVATFDDDMLQLRRNIRRQFVERTERAIRRWQAEGLADPALDPHYAASALGSMVDRSVYTWLVLGEPHDPDVALETLSRLWAKGLGLPVPAADPAAGSGGAKRPRRGASTPRTRSRAPRPR